MCVRKSEKGALWDYFYSNLQTTSGCREEDIKRFPIVFSYVAIETKGSAWNPIERRNSEEQYDMVKSVRTISSTVVRCYRK